MQNYGLVLRGTVPVGRFTIATAEDCFGRRLLHDLYIDSSLIEITKGESKEDLQFVVVEEIGGKYVKVVQDIGFGSIEGRPLVNDKLCIYKEATFVKSPQSADKSLN